MQIPSALLAAFVPVGIGAAQSIANVAQPAAASFLSVLRNVTQGNSQALPRNETAETSPFQPLGSQSHNPLQTFADRLRGWLRNAGVSGPIHLQFSADRLNNFSAQAKGDNSREIETLLAAEPSWSQEFLSLARQFQSGFAADAHSFHGLPLGHNQDELALVLTESASELRWK